MIITKDQIQILMSIAEKLVSDSKAPYAADDYVEVSREVVNAAKKVLEDLKKANPEGDNKNTMKPLESLNKAIEEAVKADPATMAPSTITKEDVDAFCDGFSQIQKNKPHILTPEEMAEEDQIDYSDHHKIQGDKERDD